MLYILRLNIYKTTVNGEKRPFQKDFAMDWILLVLAYGLIKGFREIIKKKALEKNSAIEVLFLYTLISFVFVLPEFSGAMEFFGPELLPVIFKSFCIFLAWIFGFNSIRHIPVSVYGLLDLTRVLFSTALGVIFLNEVMGPGEITGCLLVCLGLLFLKFRPAHIFRAKNADTGTQPAAAEKIGTVFILLTLLSALLNAVSGMLDKYILSYTHMSDSGLQFWYMLFLVIDYLLLIGISAAVRRIKHTAAEENSFHFVSAVKNPWIWVLAIIFVIGDRCLFIANSNPESRVTVMTLIKQSCCIVTILAGKIVFHEKEIIRKLICAAIIISGIMISVL